MKLIDDLATERTKALYDLLLCEKGKRILLAQQETPSRRNHEQEMEYLLRVTGKLPAIRGLDFIHNDFDGVVARAKEWDARGGIVTICWHTGVDGIGYPESQAENPNFDELLTEGTAANQQLMNRWDEAAKALQLLQEANIPVLWRPFHEFDGKWFWWGKGDGANFIRLWRLMVRTFTEKYELHNLIWVLGYADWVPDGWYPGDDYCDVLGSDTYKGETTHADSLKKLEKLNNEKPLAFHECGLLPRVDAFYQDRAIWSWLMPWHSKWMMEDNSEERIREVYHDERMITLDRLPTF